MCIELAFKALREANQRVLQLNDASWQPRAEVTFRVGQVVRHQKYGYRGVITGWDQKCQESIPWKRKNRIHTLKNEENQPFYNLLVDVRDDQLRQRTYAAEENLEIEKGEEEGADGNLGGCVLEHPLIDTYFDSYSFRQARYRMKDEVRSLYPED